MSDSNNKFKFDLKFGNKTDVGKVREKNEDYLESFKCYFGDVFVVCDGMGGHIGGEIASRLAVSTIKEYITLNKESITSTKEVIRNSLAEANRKIIERVQENPELRGMGTTCVILIVRAGTAYYGHIGDSRLYMIRNKKIYQLTKDQSFVQTLVDQNLISYEEAENHPRKNEITQALGISEVISPVICETGLKLYNGDRFLLCTDGLSNMVNDGILLNTVQNYKPIDASEKLVNLANSAGGFDNITLHIVEIISDSNLPDATKDITPDGALLKNTDSTGAYSTDGLNATRQIPDYKSRKSSVALYIGIIGVIALIIAIVYFAFFPTTTVPPTPPNKKDSTHSKPQSKNFPLDSMRMFMRDFYSDKEYNLPQNFADEPFLYVGKTNNHENDYTFTKLKNNIKEYKFEFENLTATNNNDGIFRFKLTLKNNSVYIIKSEIAGNKIKIIEIKYDNTGEENKRDGNEDKNKKTEQIKLKPRVNKVPQNNGKPELPKEETKEKPNNENDKKTKGPEENKK